MTNSSNIAEIDPETRGTEPRFSSSEAALALGIPEPSEQNSDQTYSEIDAGQMSFRQKKRAMRLKQSAGNQSFGGRGHLVEITLFCVVFGAIIYLSLLAILSGYDPAWIMPVTIVAMVSSLSFASFRLIRVQNQTMRNRTEMLADRLENMEDQSWEIRESEERYRSLAEAFGDLVVHRDLEGNILFANDAFCRNFGDQIDDSIPFEKQRFQLEPLPDSDFTQQDQNSSTHQARDIHLQTRLGPRWFSWLDIAIRDEDTGMSAIVSVAREITNRKDNEAILKEAITRAESASRAKSRFLATVSHEIRTPLNGILGMSDLLKDTNLSPTQNAYVEAVETSGKTLFSLVEDILDIAKIEADKLVLRPEDTSISSMVEGVVELLANASHAKGLEIISYIATDVPDRLLFDQERLRQVIVNIANNAVKFTQQGGVLVRITKLADDRENNKVRLRFEVQDTGPGLAEKDKKRIFGEFEQVDGGRNRHHNGAGLGLAISQRIIKKMGGEISAQNGIKEGSVFSFELDILVAAITDKQLTRIKPNYKHILLIAPNCFERQISANHIRDIGSQVTTCASQDEAIAALSPATQKSEPIDMVIIDSRLSVDAPELVNHLRDHTEYSFKSIVIMDPANRSSVDPMLETGIDGWLMRPVRARSIEASLTGRQQSNQSCGSDNTDTGSTTTSATGPDNSLKVLLVDDNQINQLLANAMLERSGHSSTVVDNGQSAIDEYRNSLSSTGSEYQLILMDLHMPDMDGFEAIRKIRAIETVNNIPNTPILMLSADEQEEVRIAAHQAGADGFVSKPIDSKQLEISVKLVVGQNKPI